MRTSAVATHLINPLVHPMSSQNASPSSNSKDSSPEPAMCDCQNQLAHYDWNGVPQTDLQDLCKRTMGIPLIGIGNVAESHENGEQN